MPLRVWRSDEVTPLVSHPNDPGAGPRRAPGAEFLIIFTLTIPVGTPDPAVDDTVASEVARARELAGQGHLRRLWTLPERRARAWPVAGRRTRPSCGRS